MGAYAFQKGAASPGRKSQCSWPAPGAHAQARTDAGVPEGAVRVTDDALAALVDDYARCVRQPACPSAP